MRIWSLLKRQNISRKWFPHKILDFWSCIVYKVKDPLCFYLTWVQHEWYVSQWMLILSKKIPILIINRLESFINFTFKKSFNFLNNFIVSNLIWCSVDVGSSLMKTPKCMGCVLNCWRNLHNNNFIFFN